MTQPPTYRGACHCGDVTFRVTATFTSAGACNCSICSRKGAAAKSVPIADFELLTGEGQQTDYQFGARTMHHLFCKRCGIHAYGIWGEGEEARASINLHCLEGLDVEALPVERFDGKSF
jgi:hypothetical protein